MNIYERRILWKSFGTTLIVVIVCSFAGILIYLAAHLHAKEQQLIMTIPIEKTVTTYECPLCGAVHSSYDTAERCIEKHCRVAKTNVKWRDKYINKITVDFEDGTVRTFYDQAQGTP